jgi:hypothetical protein
MKRSVTPYMLMLWELLTLSKGCPPPLDQIKNKMADTGYKTTNAAGIGRSQRERINDIRETVDSLQVGTKNG